MKKKSAINLLLVILTLIFILLGYYISDTDVSRIFYLFAVVFGFWSVMRIFNIKQIATKD